MGPPGSGKGTLSKQLSEKYKIPHISTGDLLRERKLQADELGLKIKSLIDNGLFVPDSVIVPIVSEHITKCKSGFVLDGFPRTVAQLKMLNKFFHKNEIKHLFIILDVTEQTIRKRIAGRAIVENRADDSSDKIFNERMSEYNSKTKLTIDVIREQAHIVNGENTREEVFNEVLEYLKSIEKIPVHETPNPKQ